VSNGCYSAGIGPSHSRGRRLGGGQRATVGGVLRLAEGTLVVLVGPSGAGKSSWAAEHFDPDQVVGSDRLRAVVGEGEHDLAASADAFAVLDLIVAARVRRRLTTVVDTLGLDAERRAGWIALAARRGVDCVAVVFDTPAAECRRRNATRLPRVPPAVLSGQLAAFARIRQTLVGEGFSDVLTAAPIRVVPASMTAVPMTAAPASTAPSAAATATSPADGAGGLRFGLQLSSFDAPGGPAALAVRLPTVARAAEEAGFDSVWVMDHFRQIPQLGRPWDDMLESGVTLGALAASTQRIRLGCLVNAVGYRNLGHLAKVVATLDVLSGGRAWCGVGAGWYANASTCSRTHSRRYPCCGARDRRRSRAAPSDCRRRCATRVRCRPESRSWSAAAASGAPCGWSPGTRTPAT
jgi:predicted kinase